MVKRVATGVKGLDPLVEGGIPEGNVVLVSGSTGSGKTFLGLQFVGHGASRGEPGLLITLDERRSSLLRVIEGMDVDPALLDRQLHIVDGPALRTMMPAAEEKAHGGLLRIDHLTKLVASYIERFAIKRLVLDSLTAVAFRYDSTAAFRSDLFRLCDYLGAQGLTSLLMVEVEEGSSAIDRFGVEGFLADGVIALKFEERDYSLNPTLLVRKMRYTSHPTVRFNYSLGPKGIEVHERFI